MVGAGAADAADAAEAAETEAGAGVVVVDVAVVLLLS